MDGNYILNKNREPVECNDILAWGKWFKENNRTVKVDNLTVKGKEIKVSTVFLGLDHSFSGGKPVLWETMIFGGKNDQYQDRYTSEVSALEGHKKALLLAKEASHI